MIMTKITVEGIDWRGLEFLGFGTMYGGYLPVLSARHAIHEIKFINNETADFSILELLQGITININNDIRIFAVQPILRYRKCASSEYILGKLKSIIFENGFVVSITLDSGLSVKCADDDSLEVQFPVVMVDTNGKMKPSVRVKIRNEVRYDQ